MCGRTQPRKEDSPPAKGGKRTPMHRSGCHYLGTPLAKALSAGCTADFKELEPGNTPTRLLARVQGVAPHSGGGEDDETSHLVYS